MATQGVETIEIFAAYQFKPWKLDETERERVFKVYHQRRALSYSNGWAGTFTDSKDRPHLIFYFQRS